VHYDEHFLADTARGVGLHFEGTAPFPVLTGFAANTLFGTETRHRGCGRLFASDTGHVSTTSEARPPAPEAIMKETDSRVQASSPSRAARERHNAGADQVFRGPESGGQYEYCGNTRQIPLSLARKT
jgi:hypothetical protein